jgi:polyhydroxyalkanoate synthesis regulator phasin
MKRMLCTATAFVAFSLLFADIACCFQRDPFLLTDTVLDIRISEIQSKLDRCVRSGELTDEEADDYGRVLKNVVQNAKKSNLDKAEIRRFDGELIRLIRRIDREKHAPEKRSR